MPHTLSPTALNLFKECPRCFWLQYRHSIKRPSGPFPSLPNGMDKILKEYFDNCAKEKQLPPELKKIDENFGFFDDFEKLSEWRNPFRGLRWEDSKGNVLRGAIDNLLTKENEFVIVDFKTRGFPLKGDLPIQYNLQISTYSYLLLQNGYSPSKIAYIFLLYPIKCETGNLVRFQIETIPINVNLNIVEETFNSAITTLSRDNPPLFECKFCKSEITAFIEGGC